MMTARTVPREVAGLIDRVADTLGDCYTSWGKRGSRSLEQATAALPGLPEDGYGVMVRASLASRADSIVVSAPIEPASARPATTDHRNGVDDAE